MTKREKTMVVGLLLVIVILGGYKLLIEPLTVEIEENKLEVAELRNEKQLTEIQVAQLEDFEKMLEENTIKHEELVEIVKPYYQDEQIDREVSQIIEEANMSIDSINISRSQEVDSALVESKLFQLSLYGTRENLKVLMNNIESRKDIYLDTVSVTYSDTNMESYTSKHNVPIDAAYSVSGVIFMQKEIVTLNEEDSEEISEEDVAQEQAEGIE